MKHRNIRHRPRRDVIAALTVLAALLFVIPAATAQVAGTLTFTAAATTGDGSVTPVLTWNTVPLAATCTASGDWSGQKGGSGTETLAPIVSGMTYNLTCSWPGDARATLHWTPPTTNTNGTPYTDPAGFKIYYGLTPDVSAEVATVNDGSATTFVIEPLDAGLWYFAMTALNQRGIESTRTGIVSKSITGAQSAERSLGIAVNPVPSSPLDFGVQ